jgi:hypothetical protein
MSLFGQRGQKRTRRCAIPSLWARASDASGDGATFAVPAQVAARNASMNRIDASGENSARLAGTCAAESRKTK